MKIIRYSLFFIFQFAIYQHLIANSAGASKRFKIDSLNKLISVEKSDTSLVIHQLKLSKIYSKVNTDTAKNLIASALVISNKKNNKKGLCYANYSFGEFYLNQLQYDSARKYYKESYNFSLILKDDYKKTGALKQIGKTYYFQNQYDSALYYLDNALTLSKKIRNTLVQIEIFQVLAIVHTDKGDFKKALASNFSGLKIAESSNEKKWVGDFYNSIGGIYMYNQEMNKGLSYCEKAAKLFREIGDDSRYLSAIENMASYYYSIKEYKKAYEQYLIVKKQYNSLISDNNNIELFYSNFAGLFFSMYQSSDENLYEKLQTKKIALLDSAIKYAEISIKLSQLSHNKKVEQLSISTIAGVCMIRKDYKRALKIELDLYQYAVSSGAKREQLFSLINISHCYESLKKLDSALYYYKIAYNIRDSVFNEGNQIEIGRIEENFNSEKKLLQQKIENENKLLIERAVQKSQRNLIYIAILCVIIAIIFVFILRKRLQITNKQKKIIELQKHEVDSAYGKLNEKNKEVMDSIRYAARIQRSLITSEKYITNQFRRLRKL